MNLMAQDDDGFSDPFVNVSLTNHDIRNDKEGLTLALTLTLTLTMSQGTIKKEP